jgi:hypothetical protein
MNFINLTPHAIVVINSSNEEVNFAPSGQIARVSSDSVESSPIGEFSVTKNIYGEVENLPDPQEGVYLIVSGMVLSHCKHRGDVFAPRTDGSAIRNDKGHIIAARGFVEP